eukprot:Partr_v1_DN27750_c2_g1_i7_m67791 putative Velvet factor
MEDNCHHNKIPIASHAHKPESLTVCNTTGASIAEPSSSRRASDIMSLCNLVNDDSNRMPVDGSKVTGRVSQNQIVRDVSSPSTFLPSELPTWSVPGRHLPHPYSIFASSNPLSKASDALNESLTSNLSSQSVITSTPLQNSLKQSLAPPSYISNYLTNNELDYPRTGGSSLVSNGSTYNGVPPSLEGSTQSNSSALANTQSSLANSSSSDPATSPSDNAIVKSYELHITQQPIRVRVCGFGDKDRRPIDPPPIIQLLARDADGNIVTNPDDLHFFVAHASLMSSDGYHERMLGADEVQLLMGSLVSSVYTLADLDGHQGNYFIFPDLSVRIEGEYKLRFSIMNIAWSRTAAPGESGPVVSSTMTNTFKAYTAKKFPGMLESSDLMKHFAQQGVKATIRKDGKRVNS